jgi:hypothetical protein
VELISRTQWKSGKAPLKISASKLRTGAVISEVEFGPTLLKSPHQFSDALAVRSKMRAITTHSLFSILMQKLSTQETVFSNF